SLASVEEGGVLIEGPWGRARAVAPSGEPGPGAVRGNLAVKIERAPIPAEPAEVIPFPRPPARAAGKAPSPGVGTQPTPVIPVVRGVGLKPDPDDATKKKPPFVLRLPKQKAPHLETYRSWLGVLQSDPLYLRGNPAQLDKWHQALRIGGSHAIP